MQLLAHTARSIVVHAAPEVVAAYFSRNEALLERLVGPGRVQRISDGLYRVSLCSFEALGLAVRPVLDVRFTDTPTRTLMQAERVRALDGPAGLALDAEFSGEARFDPHPEGCAIRCEASALLEIGLPLPFSALPERLLEAAATAVLARAMETTAARFERLIRGDFASAGRRAA